jgi:hypothetical protein
MASRSKAARKELTASHFHLFMEEHQGQILAHMGPSWPDFCCYATCQLIVDDLRQQFVGRFVLVDGAFEDGMPDPRLNRLVGPIGHTWIKETQSGTILDPTVGQFRDYSHLNPPVRYDNEPPYRLFTPTHPNYRWYQSRHRLTQLELANPDEL